MSGTSVDGIDAAVVHIEDTQADGLEVALVHFHSVPFDNAVREEIFRLFQPDYANVQRIGAMHARLGSIYAQAARKAIAAAGLCEEEIAFIASHGQTIWHAPEYEMYLGEKVHYTVQLGDGAVIAAQSGITTVSDFRPHDMALGGQGAPLVPFTEYLMYRSNEEGRLLLNLGGIANLTAIGKAAPPERLRAFDTGPANMLIDAAMTALFQKPMDKEGEVALRGQVNEPLLNWLMDEPYYALPPPKSTGRELFGKVKLARILDKAAPVKPEDIIATLTQLTAQTVFQAYARFVHADIPVKRVIAAGGGSRNPALMRALEKCFQTLDIRVETGETLGIHGDAKEAVAFAILGDLTLRRKVNNLPSATGAIRATVMGKIAYP